MKKYLVLALLLVCSVANAQVVRAVSVSGFKVAEVRKDITDYRIVDIVIHNNTSQAIVTVAKGYYEGLNFVTVKEINSIFMDVTDDPSTPVDETDTSFTDFITNTKLDKNVLKTIVRTKLGK